MSNGLDLIKGPTVAADRVSVALPAEADTLALGVVLAQWVRAGDCLCLWGNLGAGKTTLARGLLKGLAAVGGAKLEDIPSPTFAIVQGYEFGTLAVSHFDLYRIKTPNELEELGFDDALTGLALIEWPERAERLLPDERLDIRLEQDGAGRRAVLAGRLRRGPIAQLMEIE